MGDEAPVNTGTIKKKKDDKYRRRDPRSWDNVRKVATAMSTEDSGSYYSQMYNDIYNENRTLFVSLQSRDKQVLAFQKESDRDRAELTKSIMARGHLESLCRELQKQNKLIKEENVARIKEEEDRRREVANTFTERLNALTNLITESKDKSNKVKEENQNMTEKLTELYEQYQQRESHLETVTKQLDLQKKLAETRAKKTDIEHEAERQTYLAEKKALVMQLEQYEREIVLLQEKNRSLEAQVDLYKSQYSDFETTMTKSNKVFDTFKEEMSRMNKQLHTLESERNDLRKRWQSSVNSLIVLSEQHVALSNEQSALEKRLAMLQKLCRQLQEDRSAFLKQLKENNIEPIVPSVKSNETSENDTSEQNLETSKSSQRALKLKQELGKVKEVAALIKLGRDPPVDETDASGKFGGLLALDLQMIQRQIEVSDAKIDAFLQEANEDSAESTEVAETSDAVETIIETSGLRPKRFKASKGKKGEGDMSVAGPSHRPDVAPVHHKTSGEIETQTRIIRTLESSVQSVGSINDPFESEGLDDSLSVRRAPAATNLIREQVPSLLSLTDSEPGVNLSNITSLSETDLASGGSEVTLGAGAQSSDSNGELIPLAQMLTSLDSSNASDDDDIRTLMARTPASDDEQSRKDGSNN